MSGIKDAVEYGGVEGDDYMIPGNVDLNEGEKAFRGICPTNERVRQAKPACVPYL